MEHQDSKEIVAYLRSTKAIREQCERLATEVEAGRSEHFTLQLDKLPVVADYVIEQMRSDYPTLEIPYHSRWRHFGEARLSQLQAKLAGLDTDSAAKVRVELIIVSTLLDAGAGKMWRYKDAATGADFSASEGLAMASFDMFLDGGFSSDPDLPLQADMVGLRNLDKKALERYFQVTPQNRLAGLDGRLGLLHKLEHTIAAHKNIFGLTDPRLGNIYDYLSSHAGNNKLPARKILATLLEGLGGIWPGRVSMGGVNLGDVWHHHALPKEDFGFGLVPFHKLSQWLAYSLVEPLQESGLEINGLDELTGLAEYRNGGLFVDLGVLKAKTDAVITGTHKPESEVIVEWRALTVVLLDRLAVLIRERLGKDEDELPLAKILQGGTWSAGRRIALKLRPGGEPPIHLASDGTVF